MSRHTTDARRVAGSMAAVGAAMLCAAVFVVPGRLIAQAGPGPGKAAGDERSVPDWVPRLQALVNAEAWSDAEALCAAEAERAPDDPLPWVQLAGVHLLHGNAEAALEAYDGALGRAPGDVPIRNRRAAALVAAGRVQEAMETYLALIDEQPEFAPAHYNMGELLYKQGLWDVAVPFLEKALALGSPQAEIHYYLAEVLARDLKVEDAVRHYHQVLDINGDSAQVYTRMGDLYLRYGLLDEAVTEFANALMVDGTYADAHYGAGLALFRRAERDRAEQAFRAAILHRPGHVGARVDLATLLVLRGFKEDVAEAENLLREASTLDPTATKARYNLACLLDAQGRSEDALLEFQGVLRAQPDHAAAASGAGSLLHRLGRLDDAIALLGGALKSHPENLEIKLNLALALLESGLQIERAFGYLQDVALTAQQGNPVGIRALQILTETRRVLDERARQDGGEGRGADLEPNETQTTEGGR